MLLQSIVLAIGERKNLINDCISIGYAEFGDVVGLEGLLTLEGELRKGLGNEQYPQSRYFLILFQFLRQDGIGIFYFRQLNSSLLSLFPASIAITRRMNALQTVIGRTYAFKLFQFPLVLQQLLIRVLQEPLILLGDLFHSIPELTLRSQYVKIYSICYFFLLIPRFIMQLILQMTDFLLKILIGQFRKIGLIEPSLKIAERYGAGIISWPGINDYLTHLLDVSVCPLPSLLCGEVLALSEAKEELQNDKGEERASKFWSHNAYLLS